MSKPRTYEQQVLNEAAEILDGFSSDYEMRLLVLESYAAICGGFDINEYWSAFGIVPQDTKRVRDTSERLNCAIESTVLSPAMAISSLANEPIPDSAKKEQGVFYTDFRLAQFVATDSKKHLTAVSDVADLAAGSGILLAGIADAYYEKYPQTYDSWIANHVFAFDLSVNALRGTRIALASHTSSVTSLIKMNENWRVCDSLFSDQIGTAAYDIVVGNPPWGKVKLLRHSFLNKTGVAHVYGSDYGDYDIEQLQRDKQELSDYRRMLKNRYSLMGNGEPDLYIAFLQRAMDATKPKGHLTYIVPAGLIRSQGTECIRKQLLHDSSKLQYYLLDNKARFFEIDTRFKFLIVSHEKLADTSKHCSEFVLNICSTVDAAIVAGENVTYSIDELSSIRPDLTVPECCNNREKELFNKMCAHGCSWKNEWGPDISREIDMTNNRADFEKGATQSNIPVVEGRMVQQFRFGAKKYCSGSGRSAVWIPSSGEVVPQFYIDKEKLREDLRSRIEQPRVGYCDIAGQTNERAMMSAIIPPGVVCGNKVPTLRFANDENCNRMYLWLGVTNSFVFDWYVRRIISTTINYFLLFSVPMPDIDINGEMATSIITRARDLSRMDSSFYSDSKMAVLRAELDVLVAQASGLSFSDLEIVMQDFPLLDRAQKCINNETQAFTTRDLVLSIAEKFYFKKQGIYTRRHLEECAIGAKAYIPTEMVSLCVEEEHI